MLKNLSSLAWIFLLLLTVLALDACRTDPKPATDEVVATGPVIISSRLRGDPDMLNPYRTASSVSRYVYRNIFPTLVNYDPKTSEMSPVLAKSLPIFEDITEGEWAGGKAYTYEIHDEAVWDNGSPVQASDYIFTLKVVNNPKVTGITAAYRNILGFIREVKVDATNPRKFTVYTDKPYLDAIASTGAWIYPEYAYDPKGLMKDFSLKELSDVKAASALADKDGRLAEFAEEFMSMKFAQDKDFITNCGAYELAEWLPSQQITLKKKKNWWGEKLMDKYPQLSAYPDELIYKIVPDQNAAIALAKEGNVDIVASIPVNAYLELKDNQLIKDQYNFFTPPTYLYNYIGLNGALPKLREKEVRQALAHLLDAQGISTNVHRGMAKPLTGPMDFYEYGDKTIQPVAFDIEKAKTLLKNNNWKDSDGNGILDKVIDGKKEELDFQYYITPGNTVANSIALYFKEAAKKAGVNIRISTKEFNLLRQDFRTGDFEMYSGAHGLQPGYFDPYQHWHSESRSNYFSFGDEKSDALIVKLRESKDINARLEMYKEFQRLLYDAQPVLFVNSGSERILIHKKIKNGFGSILSPGYFENYFHY